jgi:uncharacterized protein
MHVGIVMVLMRRVVVSGFALVATLGVLAAGAAEPIRVMILDGESAGPYHEWPVVTRALEQILAEAGLFEVTVVTAPRAGGDFEAFAPEFSDYDTVVLNYDAPDGRWPAALEASFERYVREGGGVVAVHAANNAFPGWDAYNVMLGVGGWRGRDETAGPYWYFEDGELVRDDSPGPAGSHGRREPFAVTVRDERHPITRGLPRVWMHGEDELYAHLRGPGENMRVLATAWSDPANNGSGRHEPQLFALSYGSGRVFHTALGHDLRAISSQGFVVTLQRGTEWTATGDVTQPVPPEFPTADAPSYHRGLIERLGGHELAR